MKKLYLLVFLITCITLLLGQIDPNLKKRFENVKEQKGKTEVIKREILKPNVERLQKKTDTVLQPAHFQMRKSLLRTTNTVLINKWQKELK